MTMIFSAADLRKIASGARRPAKEGLPSEFFLQALTTARKGDTSFQFYTGGRHFTEEQMGDLKSLGYQLIWNRPCLWYEVDFKESP